jgi:hypothetical protein
MALVAALLGGIFTFIFAAVVLLRGADSNLVSDGGADPLAWGLVFLMGGMSAFFALLGFVALPKSAAKPAEKSKDDETMETVARWVRGANLLAEGVEQIGAHSYVLDVSIARRAHDLLADAAKHAEKARGLVRSPDLTLPDYLAERRQRLGGLLEAAEGAPPTGLGEAVRVAKAIRDDAGLSTEQRDAWRPVVGLLEAALAGHDAGRALTNAAGDLLEAARRAKEAEQA